MVCASPSKAIITSTERNPGEVCNCYRRYPLSLQLERGRELSEWTQISAGPVRVPPL